MSEKKPTTKDKVKPEEPVLLEDLAPHEDVRGGNARLRFGQEPQVPGRAVPKKKRTD